MCARLLGQKNSLDVGQDSPLGDGHSLEQFVQLFVVPDGQLEMAGVDPLLLVVPSGVAGQLEDLGGEILHDGGQVDWGAGTDPLGVVSLTEKTVDTTDWELEPSAGGAALGLGAGLASFSTS